MSSRRLIAYVHVGGGWYGPGDEVPAKIARQIGDHAWTTDSAETPDEQQAGDEAPPRAGRGSGIEAWLAFAEKHGVDTDSDMTRDDVIAACEAAGVVEPEQPKE